MAGRPTKFEPDKADAILVAVRRGMSYKAAAAVAGITYQTLYNWEQRGKEEIKRVLQAGGRARTRSAEEPFVHFYIDLQKARSQGEFTLADIIREAAEGGGEIKETKVVQVMVAGQVIKETNTTITKQFPPDWRAAAFMLERRFGWTQRSQNLNIDYSSLTDDEIERVAAGEDPLAVLADRLDSLEPVEEGEA